MPEMLAAATQESVRRVSTRNRVANTPEYHEPGPSTGRRGPKESTSKATRAHISESEDNEDRADSDAGSEEDVVDMKGYNMKDFKGAPVEYATPVDRVVSGVKVSFREMSKLARTTDQSSTSSVECYYQGLRGVHQDLDRCRRSA
jgi:hypothetical protein